MQYEILRSPGVYGGLPGGEICGNGRQTLMHEKEPGQHGGAVQGGQFIQQGWATSSIWGNIWKESELGCADPA